MAAEAHGRARARLSAVAEDPAGGWDPAIRLAQDAALLGRLLAAAAGQRQDSGQCPDVSADEVAAGLSLFEVMRVALDRLETQVVIEARRRGMDWRQIAGHQGLNSSQAASQRYQRLVTRLEEIRQGVR
ncbi:MULTISPECIES: hypothetical protein [Streptomyces]|uniref:DNA-binding protein n=2 Tax=Streptomyces lividans TaxID=1916 RepID=A0A7U9E0L6_STRLI|nr:MULTISPECIES: hypothetical protein [Streptomyces]QSJ06659.1 hypothetical protein SLIVDG2_00640 [Streptomyces lividans]WTE16205.1 hypothetical protein OH747_00765 [Streptomyces anthocyanicus]AIJ11157.1 hypothetical protein SLIV_00640 [Streptomyces lividans TK24]EFD64467.1 conserved hypothetical protein [Streptomyces lividans TK24]EOY52665.1 hypothetical protein SLI_7967 [Streptomyces lividans 1326]